MGGPYPAATAHAGHDSSFLFDVCSLDTAETPDWAISTRLSAEEMSASM